jgi:hypothetical protein
MLPVALLLLLLLPLPLLILEPPVVVRGRRPLSYLVLLVAAAS